MKWALWNSIKVMTLWILLVVLIGGALFIIAQHDDQLIKDSNLDVERPTTPPATSTVAASKEPVVVIVPAINNEPRYAASNLYSKVGMVIRLDAANDEVTFTDTRGMVWSFYRVEDWQEGDLLCAIFYDADTIDPYDDSVIGATYQAWDY